MPKHAVCACLELGPKYPDVSDERDVGCDLTEGRFADVTLLRCARCGRLWLRYAVEYEAFTASGRWAEAPIDDASAANIRPETAAKFLETVDWHIRGGSYWGHTAKRNGGPIHWGP